MALPPLIAKLGLDLSDFRAALNEARNELTTVGKRIEGLGQSMARGGAVMTAAVTVPLAGLGLKAIETAGSIEQVAIAFDTMLGSAERATKFLAELKEFAIATPFEFKDLVIAAERLLALGFSAEQVIPTLRAVGDATAALGGGAEKIDAITRALGQMLQKGKVSAEEMKQLSEAGIPAWQMLAEAARTSVADMQQRVRTGFVDAAEAVTTILAGMQERFGGLMERQSQTVLGMWSSLKDRIFFLLEEIGKPLLPVALSMIRALTPLLEAVSALAAAFGSLPAPVQTAVIAIAALAAAIGPVVVVAGAVVSSLGTLMSVVGAAGGVIGILTAAVSALGPVLTAVAAGFAAWKLAEWMGLLDPIIGMVKAITRACVEFGGVLLELADVIAGALVRALQLLGKVLHPIVDVIVAFPKLIIEALGKAWNAIADFWANIRGWLGKLPGLSDALKMGLAPAVESVTTVTQKASVATSKATIETGRLTAALATAAEEARHTALEYNDLSETVSRLSRSTAAQELEQQWLNTFRLARRHIEGLTTVIEELPPTITPPLQQVPPLIQANINDAITETTRSAGNLNKVLAETSAEAPSQFGTVASAARSAGEAIKNDYGRAARDTLQQVSTAVTNAAQSIVGMLIGTRKGSILDALKTLGTSIVSALIEPWMSALNSLIESGIKKLISWLSKDLLGAVSHASSAVKSFAQDAAAAIGGVRPTAPAGGAAAAGGAAGIVGAIGAVTGAVFGALSFFQARGQGKTLDLIEENTRFTAIGIVGSVGVIDILHSIENVLWHISDGIWDLLVPPIERIHTLVDLSERSVAALEASARRPSVEVTVQGNIIGNREFIDELAREIGRRLATQAA